MNIISYISEKYPGFLNRKILKELLIGLDLLIIESNQNNELNSMDIQEKLIVRKSAANLAYKLFQYYTFKKESIPNTILSWKEICADPNEFAEIRNSWI